MQALTGDAKQGNWLDPSHGLRGADQPGRRLPRVLAAASLAALLAVFLPANMGAQNQPAAPAKDALSIDANSNVGIGTTSPRNPFVVFDSTHSSGLGIQPGCDGENKVCITGNNGGARYFVIDDAKKAIQFWTSNQQQLTVDSSGNVGIGTTTPNANSKLDVNGDVNIAKTLSVMGTVGIGTNKTGRSLTILGAGYSSDWLLFADWKGTERYHFNFNGGGFNLAETGVKDYRLFIQAGTGNVGIGKIPEANAKLDVAGNATVSGTVKAIGGIVPAYDSGWRSDDHKSDHPVIFEHKLNRLPSLVMLFFSPDGGKTEFPVNLERTQTAGNPVSTEVTSTYVTLFIHSGNYLHQIWRHDKGWTSYDTGSWRVVVF